jgi:hypothetical protein
MASEFRSPENRPRTPRSGLGTMSPAHREKQPQHRPFQMEHPPTTHPETDRDGVRAP